MKDTFNKLIVRLSNKHGFHRFAYAVIGCSYVSSCAGADKMTVSVVLAISYLCLAIHS